MNIKPKFNFITILCSAFILLLISHCKDKPKKKKKHIENRAASKVLIGPIHESKIVKLLHNCNPDDKFEASGLTVKDGSIYLVFDNRFQVAKIDQMFSQNSLKNILIGEEAGNSNFEGITFKEGKNTTWFIVEETAENNSQWSPRFNIYQNPFSNPTQQWAEVNFDSENKNKGFEGIAYIQRNNHDYILSILEGTGQIFVLQEQDNRWLKVAELTIPVSFNDYSEITLYKNKIAVTSQKDAKLWIGELDDQSWAIVHGVGEVYDFPKGNVEGELGKGENIIYANIEGLAFLDDSTLVTCTDKASDKQPSYQSIKDQSVQIFRLR